MMKVGSNSADLEVIATETEKCLVDIMQDSEVGNGKVSNNKGPGKGSTSSSSLSMGVRNWNGGLALGVVLNGAEKAGCSCTRLGDGSGVDNGLSPWHHALMFSINCRKHSTTTLGQIREQDTHLRTSCSWKV